MTHLDLFSGIGGFHLGLEMAGFKFDKVFYSDIDPYANKVYAKNFPAAASLGDITKIDPNSLPDIDIVTAGFPCQDISVAGKQGGLNAKRSGLFYEIIRLCSVVRPKVLFLENVQNLISGNGGEWMRAVLTALAEIGYDAEWEIIRASDVGAPHRRARIWIVAYPKHNEHIREKSRKPQEKRATQSENRQDNSGARKSCGTNDLDGGHEKQPAKARVNAQRESAGLCEDVAESSGKRRVKGSECGQDKGGSRVKRQKISVERGGLRYSGKDWWSSEPNVGRVAHGVPSRVDRLKCLGNAVVPQCVELVGRMILESGLLKEN